MSDLGVTTQELLVTVKGGGVFSSTQITSPAQGWLCATLTQLVSRSREQ